MWLTEQYHRGMRPQTLPLAWAFAPQVCFCFPWSTDGLPESSFLLLPGAPTPFSWAGFRSLSPTPSCSQHLQTSWAFLSCPCAPRVVCPPQVLTSKPAYAAICRLQLLPLRLHAGMALLVQILLSQRCPPAGGCCPQLCTGLLKGLGRDPREQGSIADGS